MSANDAVPLRRPALVLVTDSERLRGRAIEDVVRAAVRGGVDAVQLREKGRPHGVVVATGARVRSALSDDSTLFVNGDIDAALALGAPGLHLPEDCGTIGEARERLGAAVLVSRAVHSVEAAVHAEEEGADIVQLGTVFETASKPGRQPIGLEGIRAVCTAVRMPVIAIGGITAANAAAVMRAGAYGVAVVGAIFDADDARAAAAGLREVIDAAHASG